MNLFGLDISLSRKEAYNGDGHVKEKDCERTHDTLADTLDSRFTSLKEHIDTRINDLKDFIKLNGRGG